MDISINVEVYCQEEPAGRVVALVVHPETDELTHLVLQRAHHSHEKYLVPIRLVAESTPEHVRLDLPLDSLDKLDPFVETKFVRVKSPQLESTNPIYFWTVMPPEDLTMLVEDERVPKGERAIHQGARVEATDGVVGKVREVILRPEDDRITHIVLAEGPFWDKKNVTVPVSQIARIDDDTIYLKIEKDKVGKLAALPREKNTQ